MFVDHWARETPDRVAIQMAGSGEAVTFAELEQASNRGAHLMRQLGLTRGDVFAVWSGNNPRYLEIAITMQRSGLYMCPIAAKLTAPEAAYIVQDSGARVLIIDASIGAPAEEMARNTRALCPNVERIFAIRGDLPGVRRWETEISARPATPIADQSLGAPSRVALPGVRRWETEISARPATPIADQSLGQTMIYSSGTTGKPKGVHRPLSDNPHDGEDGLQLMHRHLFKSTPGTTFLATAPLYHSGPLHFVLAELKLGATVLVLEKFDAERVLAGIEQHRVARGQFVPTMFTRMLKLPEEVRGRYDLSSLQLALHSAAPCPVEVKRGMIDWWGPVLVEIYGGTENAGSTMIDSHEWLRKPGSVGKSTLGVIHVCSEDGRERPPGETGLIYFEGNAGFDYLNDDAKTRDSRHPDHPTWATFGDIGHVDEDGYLFLSDRRAFMIICGGVNIYPQEAENALTLHPKVADVAVFGVPDSDMGEQVKAVVQPAEGAEQGPDLEAELIAWCKSQLASLKCPRSIDFADSLPRDPTGKMLKKQLRDSYWQAVPTA